MICWPYPPNSVAFMFDLSIATPQGLAAAALAKHVDFDGQEIWRVDFDHPTLVTTPDKTPNAWEGSVVADAPFRDRSHNGNLHTASLGSRSQAPLARSQLW